MEHVISDLLHRYETGGVTRRELVCGLAMLAGGAAAGGTARAQSATMKFQWEPLIDHIQINAEDVPHCTEFYQKVLGLDLLRVGPPNDRNCCPNESAFLGVGKRLIVAIRKRTPGKSIDHCALLMNNFNQTSVTDELKRRGAEPAKHDLPGYYVRDPEGTLVQLMGQPGPA
jgi:catechol 2,3-dioxygenase-like lactoylglutathione lyase family enzyme